MANVTYIFGAGASANCLPTYANFPEHYGFFCDFLARNDLRTDRTETQIAFVERVKTDAILFREEFTYHNTPDTIAKKYFHQPGSSPLLPQLKRILILFFIFSQSIKDKKKVNVKYQSMPVDKRYDSFIAAILQPRPGKLKLYNQFKILTWNYDLQFELAFSRYSGETVSKTQNQFQCIPNIDSFSKEFDYSRFGLVHLNGIAYASPDLASQKDYIGELFSEDVDLLDYLLTIYDRLLNDSKYAEKITGTLFNFAWENVSEENGIYKPSARQIEVAIEIARGTEVLVIIGYSFPIFNNTIDKEIFSAMQVSLEKIYIQSPDASNIAGIIRSDLLSDFDITGDRLVELPFYSQFHIPAEWNRHLGEPDYSPYM